MRSILTTSKGNKHARPWRVLAHETTAPFEVQDRGDFDELVVGDWLHVEQMAANQWWLRVGDARLYLTFGRDEAPTVDITRGFYGPLRGSTGVAVGAFPHGDLSERRFQVWEYRVSHKQLLVRSPQSPATRTSAGHATNIDLVCSGVEYMALPHTFRGLELVAASSEELAQLESILGRRPDPNHVRVVLSEGKRFPIVAWSFALSENDWDIFDSPFEYRSRFRGSATQKPT